MHRILNRDQILTIPNLLSLLRFLMIPVIVWLYLGCREYYLTVAVVILSGVTDVLDGILARKLGQVSDFGKILDPVADKCTQGTLILCLTARYPLMWALIGLFLLKEIVMSAFGCFVLRRTHRVHSAKWHGKANTVILYAVLLLLIAHPAIPLPAVNGMILFCCVSCVFSFCLYALFYLRALSSEE